MNAIPLFVGAVVLVVGLYAGFAWIFMSLWNWLVPALFTGPIITYWQSAGIMFLGSMIGGWFRSSSSGGNK